MNRSKYFICQDGSIKILKDGFIVKINNKVSICDIDIPIKFNDSDYYDDICQKAINYFKKEILHDYATQI